MNCKSFKKVIRNSSQIWRTLTEKFSHNKNAKSTNWKSYSINGQSNTNITNTYSHSKKSIINSKIKYISKKPKILSLTKLNHTIKIKPSKTIANNPKTKMKKSNSSQPMLTFEQPTPSPIQPSSQTVSLCLLKNTAVEKTSLLPPLPIEKSMHQKTFIKSPSLKIWQKWNGTYLSSIKFRTKACPWKAETIKE